MDLKPPFHLWREGTWAPAFSTVLPAMKKLPSIYYLFVIQTNIKISTNFQ